MVKNGQFDSVVYAADLIERYIRKHPKQMDSLEGILDWWRTQEKLGESAMIVTDALHTLIEKGVLEAYGKDFYRFISGNESKHHG